MGQHTVHRGNNVRSNDKPGAALRTLLALLAAGAVAVAFSGCRTTEGAGKDIEKLGENIKDKAQDAQD